MQIRAQAPSQSDIITLFMDNAEGEDKPNFNDFQEGMKPIDLLRPGTDHHTYVLNYLLRRIKTSEDKMSRFYARWQIAERKFQAFLSLPNYEQMLRDMNDSSKPPAPAIIIFPYKYAVISTIVTYMMRVFCGKKPYLNLGAKGKEEADTVRYFETMLQYQCDMSKMVMRLFQLFLDGELYGLAVIRCLWKTKQGKRTVLRAPTETELFTFASQSQQLPGQIRERKMRTVFEGNEYLNIDPFMFFPDPNVPMNEVASKGEYVFWREFTGKHELLRAQADGMLKYVETLNPYQGQSGDSKWFNYSNRSAISQGDSHAGDSPRSNFRGSSTFMIDQGSVEIVPKELGLGTGTRPEKWLFTIANKTQIIQAEPLDLDHDRHPIEVSEPYSMGYGFGQPSMSDYAGPLQDILSWFVDSHIYNIRSALNNQWLYDPSKIDENSLKYKQPGKHIKLKPTAFGTDVRQALMQFPVSDVTRGHMADITTFIQIGDMVSSVNDPMRGVMQNGRRTAAETRITTDSAGARLTVHAEFISQQCTAPLTEQSVSNIQQNQSAEFWTRIIGPEAFNKVGQALLTGDYTFPVQDGTLPLDRVANFDMWKEILTGMAQSPLLMQTHSLPRIFENVCTLGGAPNITSFRLVSDQQMDELAKAGNVVPLNQVAAGAASHVNNIPHEVLGAGS